jgi:F-type H+-transporting ATPase subunit b
MTISNRLRLLPLTLLAIAMFAPVRAVYASASVFQASEPAQQEVNREEKDENDAYRHSAMVQKLGKMMGMSTETAATSFEVANFAVLALLLGFALLKTMPKLLRDRSAAIQKHLVDARVATEEANARLSSVEDRLAKLDGQIAEMRAQAEKDAATEEQRMRAAVENEKTRILAAADQEIASASMMAQRTLQRYAAELAIEQAARKLVVTAETDRLLVQNFARRLTGNDSNGGQN